jgi:NADH-quinone oxidoreductase subunit M
MNLLHLPWLELTLLLPWIGSLWVSRKRDPQYAAYWSLQFTALTFVSAFFAWFSFYQDPTQVGEAKILNGILGHSWFKMDELTSPLIPLTALLYCFTPLVTARTKMRRFSFTSSLVSEGLMLAIFCCVEPWILILLLSLGTMPPFAELISRVKPKRVYVLHMGLYISLMVLGQLMVEWEGPMAVHSAWATLPLMIAVLIRSGIFPMHVWLPDLFEQCGFGTAILFVAPLSSAYAAIRLVLPISPEWILQSLSILSLFTAVYAAGMATIQTNPRRFFSFLFLSHASLIFVGLELLQEISLTGAFCLWFSVGLSLGCFGLVLRAVEARVGQLSFQGLHGLYDQMPILAICFLVTGLASVGFPGTLGFISSELLVDGAIEENLLLGIAVVFASALNGIAVVRAYFSLFTGTSHRTSISLRISPRERFAFLTMVAMILGGGLMPSPGVQTRHLAAEAVLKDRKERQKLSSREEIKHNLANRELK